MHVKQHGSRDPSGKISQDDGENYTTSGESKGSDAELGLAPPYRPVPQYNAESPDEGALVMAAAKLGFEFMESQNNRKVIEIMDPNSLIRRTPMESSTETAAAPVAAPVVASTVSYEVLAVNEFNSTRKRMSVLVVEPVTGKHVLFCKGADNVILERACTGGADDPIHAGLSADLKRFATDGLRTLVCAYRELSEKESNVWLREYEAAKREIDGRKAKLAAVAEKIERNLTIVGASESSLFSPTFSYRLLSVNHTCLFPNSCDRRQAAGRRARDDCRPRTRRN